MRFFIIGVIAFSALLMYGVFSAKFGSHIKDSFHPVLEVDKKSVNKKSFLEIAIINLAGGRDQIEGKPLIQPNLNSDKSQCSKQPTIDEKIITEFAGYILEYPCTARSKGEIRTYFDEDNNPYKKFNLYLNAALGEVDKSIWSLGPENNKKNKMPILIYLQTDGIDIPIPSLVIQMKEKYKIQEIQAADLVLYYDKPRVVGFLMEEKDASGHSPAIQCLLPNNIEVEDVFSPLYGLKEQYPRNCIATWMLTKDISLSVHLIKMQYAYHFKQIFQQIDKDLQDIIKTRP